MTQFAGPSTFLSILLLAAAIPLLARGAAQDIRAIRFTQNPLVTVDSSRSLGRNVNGPTVIRVPDWVERPLGRYYMYFANHMGTFIRLAYADAVTGPWRIYEPGVLHVRDTAFFRPQPDPEETLADFYTHVASPEVLVDHANRRLVIWAHGWWTNGERWPGHPAEARAWARRMGYGQFTQAAESTDGRHFKVQPAITRHSYLRVVEHGGYFYALSRLGQLSRSRDALASFAIGPNPFRDTAYAGRVRHVGLMRRGDLLYGNRRRAGTRPRLDDRHDRRLDALACDAAGRCSSARNALRVRRHDGRTFGGRRCRPQRAPDS